MSRRLWLLLSALISTSAFADAYDFQIYQLGNPQKDGVGYSPSANARFRSFARTLGAAVTAVNGSPPATLGHSAFAITAETSMVFLTQNAPVNQMPTVSGMDHPLILPSIHLRKGLPWSFEVGVRAGWLERSRMGIATLELKWALNEGFTYLPDIAVRGHITKILNSRDFDLTTGGLDLAIGKKFAIGGMITLTPYLGWNLAFTGAASNNVDFKPTRSLADSDQPNAQFTDYTVFANVNAGQNNTNRFYGGLRFIGGYVTIGIEGSYTALGSFVDSEVGTVNQQTGPGKPGSQVAMPDVAALNFSLGFDF